MSEKLNKKMIQSSGNSGGWKLRIWQSRGDKKCSPSFLVKCGCCNEKVKIYYDKDRLEINGVLSSKEEWRKLFKLCGFEI